MTFIVFEGIDGSGKTTLIKKITPMLGDVVVTHEPYTFDKETLKKDLGDKYNIYNSVFFFLLDRVVHCERVIRPALDNNKKVLCDRYIYSTYAYDGVNYAIENNTTVKEGVDEIIKHSNHMLEIMGETICTPDLVFYIKTDPNNSVIRKGEDLEYMKLVSDAYDYIFSTMTNCIIIDGAKPIKEIVEEVKQYI
jgi:dTMP kinase